LSGHKIGLQAQNSTKVSYYVYVGLFATGVHPGVLTICQAL